jgi:hypothetical protein
VRPAPSPSISYDIVLMSHYDEYIISYDQFVAGGANTTRCVCLCLRLCVSPSYIVCACARVCLHMCLSVCLRLLSVTMWVCVRSYV